MSVNRSQVHVRNIESEQAMSDNTFTQDFNEVKAEDNAISADQLRDLVETRSGISLDSKSVRARLRKMKARDQASLKGARWRIDKTLAQEFVDHYEKRASEQAS